VTATALLLAVGNESRGDDAAGLLVARRLRHRTGDVTVREMRPDGIELLEVWQDAESVVIVDATSSGAPPGTITRFDAVAGALPASTFAVSTHVVGVAQAVELARTLGRLPARLIVIGIEGRRFGQGDALSPEVGSAVEEAAERALKELRSRA
jgi:hydrogenase maturation protease